jgi:hypothetical protein
MRPSVAPRVSDRLRTVTVLVAVTLLMAACTSGGGGGGGGGGNADYVLYVLFVNHDPNAAHTLSYSGGAALASSPDSETAEPCTAAIVHYPVEVPFELLVDDVPIVISDELPFGVPEDGEANMITRIDVNPDGQAESVIGDSSGGMAVVAGTSLGKPAAISICL